MRSKTQMTMIICHDEDASTAICGGAIADVAFREHAFQSLCVSCLERHYFNPASRAFTMACARSATCNLLKIFDT